MTSTATTLPNPADPISLIDEIKQEDINDVGLTPQQQNQWQETMSLMAWTAPGFRHLFYKLLVNHRGNHACIPTRAIPVAATDGRNILINPDTFFKFDLRQRVFIIGHEVMHNVYKDVDFLYRCRKAGTVPMNDGTTLPFDEKSMQHAMDYRINALLRDSKIGVAPKDCLLNDEIAKANEGIIDVYKKVYQDYESNGQLGGQGFDLVLNPGASTGQSPQQAQQNGQQWAVESKAAQTLEEMRSKGKMAGALKRMFEQVLNPQIPWTEKIRGIFNRKVGNGSYDWRKADRRFIVRDLYMPGRSGNGAGHVVVWGDTSGSIGTKELCHYMAELTSIVEECQPARLTILWCDADIHRIDELSDPTDMAKLQYDAAKDGVGGGGGTSCHPVFEWIAQNCHTRPDALVCFTDGYVDFPDAPPPVEVVIWASTVKGPEDYPYGDVVEINTRGS
jgi:predicted metal-dependent peptidase